MAGVRETKTFPPTPEDEDANGYFLAYKNVTDDYNGRGWIRTRHVTFSRNPNFYPYWLPMKDLALMPFHKE